MFDRFIHNNNYFYSHKNQLEYVFQKNIYNKQNQFFFLIKNVLVLLLLTLVFAFYFNFHIIIFIMEKTNKPLNEEKKNHILAICCAICRSISIYGKPINSNSIWYSFPSNIQISIHSALSL